MADPEPKSLCGVDVATLWDYIKPVNHLTRTEELIQQPESSNVVAYRRVQMKLWMNVGGRPAQQSTKVFQRNYKHVKKKSESLLMDKAVSCTHNQINEIEDKDIKIQTRNKLIQDQEHRLKSLMQELEVQKASINEWNDKHREYLTKIEKLDDDLFKSKSEVQIRTQEAVSIGKKMEDIQGQMKDLRKENKDLEFKIDASETKNSELVTSYEAQIKELLLKLESLQKEVENSSTEKLKLEEQVKAMEKEYEVHMRNKESRTTARTQEIIEERKTEEEKIAEEMRTLMKEIDVLRMKIHEGNLKFEARNEENKDLQFKLMICQSEKVEIHENSEEVVNALNKEILFLKKELEKVKVYLKYPDDVQEKLKLISEKILKDQKLLHQLKKEIQTKNAINADVSPHKPDTESAATMTLLLQASQPMSPMVKALTNQLQESQNQLFDTLEKIALDDEERRALWNNTEFEKVEKFVGSKTVAKFKDRGRRKNKRNECNDALMKCWSISNGENLELRKEKERLNADNNVCRTENTKLAKTIRNLEEELKEINTDVEDSKTMKIKLEDMTNEMDLLQRKIKRLEEQNNESEHCIDLLNNDVQHYRRTSVTLENSSRQCCHQIKIKKEKLEEKLIEMEEEHQDCHNIARRYQAIKRELLKCRYVIRQLQQDEKAKTEMNEANQKSDDEGNHNVASTGKHVINLQVHVEKDGPKTESTSEIVLLRNDLQQLNQEIALLQDQKSCAGCKDVIDKQNVEVNLCFNPETKALQDELQRMQKELLQFKNQENRKIEKDIVEVHSNTPTSEKQMDETEKAVPKTEELERELVIEEEDEAAKVKEKLFQKQKEELHSLQMEKVNVEAKLMQVKSVFEEFRISTENNESKYKKRIAELETELNKYECEDNNTTSKREEINTLNIKIKEMKIGKEKNENLIRNLKETKSELQMDIGRMEREISNLKQKLDFTDSTRQEKRNAECLGEKQKPVKNENKPGYPLWLKNKTENENSDLNKRNDQQSSKTAKPSGKPIWLRGAEPPVAASNASHVADNDDGILMTENRRGNVASSAKNNSRRGITNEEAANDDFLDMVEPLKSNKTSMSSSGRRTDVNIQRKSNEEKSDDGFLNLKAPIKSNTSSALSHRRTAVGDNGRNLNVNNDESDDDFLDTPIKAKKTIKPKKALSRNGEPKSNGRRQILVEETAESEDSEEDFLNLDTPIKSWKPHKSSIQTIAKSLPSNRPQKAINSRRKLPAPAPDFDDSEDCDTDDTDELLDLNAPLIITKPTKEISAKSAYGQNCTVKRDKDGYIILDEAAVASMGKKNVNFNRVRAWYDTQNVAKTTSRYSTYESKLEEENNRKEKPGQPRRLMPGYI